ncbi:endonuclease [Lysobacteraceae bacterium NML95-0200]|nr:endonuclease [Xanthomonadaceae bacterium NML95-0200]
MSAQLQTIPHDQHDRQKLIGGSDVAGILGISPWKTPLDVYMDKVQPRNSEPDRNKARVFARGKRMEPYVIDMLAEESGLEIVARGNRYLDAEHPFLAAEIDAEAKTGENIEIKTVSPFKAWEWGEEQTDSVPVHYTAQAMHGLMVTNRKVCVFGVLIGGDDFRIYRVERDEETIDAIRAKELEFWQRVQRKDPPEATRVSDILAMFDRDAGTSLEADTKTLQAIGRMREINAITKPLNDEFADLREQVQLYMRDAAVLKMDGQPLATWKSQTANRFNQTAFKEAHPDLFEQFKQASQSRVFRLK